MTEKNGNLLNFDPSKYAYDPVTDTITSTGLIVAGNNPHGTPGVSNSTLTGRQWGFAPRIGVAWSPKMFNSKVVVRAGWGMYYDRGELYTYLSPGVAQSITPGGPFGINQQVPFVGTQFCTGEFGGTGAFQPCVAGGDLPSPGTCPPANQLACPWGASLLPPPAGNPTTIAGPDAKTGLTYLPKGNQLAQGNAPFYLGVYARNNKLPYTMNATLDIQWQPRNDLAIDIGYVNALGRHEIVPLPFNQSRIASPGNPLCGPTAKCPNAALSPFAQSYTYGYNVQSKKPIFFNSDPLPLQDVNGHTNETMVATSEGGNVDLRVPYIGYAGESEAYTAEGISAYNALQAHVEKRLSHGLQAGVSYTFSRAFDEQSAMGLFYNGSNPLQLRGGYAPSDYDRTHVFNVDYHYELPKFLPVNTWGGKVVDGWAIQGLVVIQSGQPYSVIDYSGAVGSIFYSINDGITNPIVPLVTIPILQPGDLNGAIPAGDSFETNFIPNGGQRNIFRQSWQKRADISIVKVTALTERVSLKYSIDVFNLTNHPSFDIPIDNIDQNLTFNPTPTTGQPAVPSAAACAANGGNPFVDGNLYQCPTGIGQVVHTIGGSRQVQMSLSLQF